ncbi:MAG: helix-turn-helix domain-containing protein, partial [Proteobacteria bacterium]|nr:helix-turn-helix domain-containing protein [Pseudomonadota bacterium]
RHYLTEDDWSDAAEFGALVDPPCGFVTTIQRVTSAWAHVTCPGCLAVRPASAEGSTWLTVVETCAWLGLSERHVRDQIAAGAFDGAVTRLGRTIRIHRHRLEDLLLGVPDGLADEEAVHEPSNRPQEHVLQPVLAGRQEDANPRPGSCGPNGRAEGEGPARGARRGRTPPAGANAFARALWAAGDDLV